MNDPYPMRMPRRTKHPARIAALGILLAASVLLQHVAAQSGGTFAIHRSTVDGGGGSSAGATYKLSGTAGQPDAAVASGGTLEVRGGFWGADTQSIGLDDLFFDGFEPPP